MVEGLLFEAATKADDGYIYAVSSRCNALYKIDSNNRATYIGNLWMEPYNRKRLSFFAIAYKDYVYFAPKNGALLWYYDTKKQVIEYIEIYNKDELCIDICEGVIYDNKLILFSAKMDFIVTVDCKTNKLVSFTQYNDIGIYCRKGLRVNNKYYIPSTISGTILIVDLKTLAREEYYIDDFRGAWNVSRNKDDLWMAPRYEGDPILQLSITSGICQKHNIGNKKTNVAKYLYSFFYEDSLCVIGDDVGDSFIYDTNKHKVEWKWLHFSGERNKVLIGYKDNDYLVIALYKNGADVFSLSEPVVIKEIDTKTLKVRDLHYIEDERNTISIQKKMRVVMYENDKLDLRLLFKNC